MTTEPQVLNFVETEEFEEFDSNSLGQGTLQIDEGLEKDVPADKSSFVYIGKSPNEDLINYNCIYENQLHPNRRIRITNSKRNNRFVQFKVFKYNYTDVVWRMHQNLSVSVLEADKLMLQLRPFKDQLRQMLSKVEKLPVVEKFVGGKITPNVDEKQVHWFRDVNLSPKRWFRISAVVYNKEQPFASTYVQLKLFQRESLEEVYLRHQIVSFTLREFCELADKESIIDADIKNFCYVS